MKIRAYMVVKANGEPAIANISSLRIKADRAMAVGTVKWLDNMERSWLPEYKNGPHKIIEVTITPVP